MNAGLASLYEGKHPYGIHACRRSFATWLDEVGAPGESIDLLLGHEEKSVRAKFYTAHTMHKLLVRLAPLVCMIDLPLDYVADDFPEPVTLPPVRGSQSGPADDAAMVQLHQTSELGAKCEIESPVNSAPPARLERTTFGLGKRSEDELLREVDRLRGVILESSRRAATALEAVSSDKERGWRVAIAELGTIARAGASVLPELDVETKAV